MKIIQNNVIPFKGYTAINILGIVFVRKDVWKYKKARSKQVTLNHEAIHTAQQKELLFIGFYILYLFEWLYRLVFHTKDAYRGISFEKEAYDNQLNLGYLKNRKHYSMWFK